MQRVRDDRQVRPVLLDGADAQHGRRVRVSFADPGDLGAGVIAPEAIRRDRAVDLDCQGVRDLLQHLAGRSSRVGPPVAATRVDERIGYRRPRQPSRTHTRTQRKASRPPPTNVAQGPQPSVTVIGTCDDVTAGSARRM